MQRGSEQAVHNANSPRGAADSAKNRGHRAPQNRLHRSDCSRQTAHQHPERRAVGEPTAASTATIPSVEGRHQNSAGRAKRVPSSQPDAKRPAASPAAATARKAAGPAIGFQRHATNAAIRDSTERVSSTKVAPSASRQRVISPRPRRTNPSGRIRRLSWAGSSSPARIASEANAPRMSKARIPKRSYTHMAANASRPTSRVAERAPPAARRAGPARTPGPPATRHQRTGRRRRQ